MSLMSVSGSFVHSLTINRLFHEWSIWAPGNALVTSAWLSAYTMNCITVPLVARVVCCNVSDRRSTSSVRAVIAS